MDPDIEQGQLQLWVKTILFTPAVSPLCDCITFLTSKANCSNETSPFWVGSPLNVVIFGILPTTCKATLRQEISCCGSNISRGNCVLVPSTNTLSSLPTQCNPSLPLSSAQVWQHHIQCVHCDPAIFRWITMVNVTFQYFHFMQRLTKCFSHPASE